MKGPSKPVKKREAVSELELEVKAGRVTPIYLIAANLQALAPLWISPESKPSASGRSCVSSS
jgi:inorganic triphosphatase YgiF